MVPPCEFSGRIQHRPRSVIFYMKSLALVFALAVGGQTMAEKPIFKVTSRPQELTMAFQQMVPRDRSELKVQFVGYRDMRCPVEAICEQPDSEADVEAYFYVGFVGRMNSKSGLLTLKWGTGDPWKRAVSIGNYEFALRSLEPRPSSRASDPGRYKAVILARLRNAPEKVKPK